jgi:hypothetical protein
MVRAQHTIMETKFARRKLLKQMNAMVKHAIHAQATERSIGAPPPFGPQEKQPHPPMSA